MVNPAKSKKKDSNNVLADPALRKKFKSALATVTHYLEQIDNVKDGMKESISDLSTEYGLDKKTIRKMASTMHKHNYGSLLEENRHFEELYEIIIEGKLRDPDDYGSAQGDPLDKQD